MILKRYINGDILRTSIAILLVLILIFISTRFIKYIQLAVDGTISSQAVFSLLGLQVPSVAGFLIPMSFFIAILLTMGRLYSENEMTVMQSVGVSEMQIARGILPLALILGLLAFVLAFWVTPWAAYKSNTLLAKEKAESKFGAFAPGRFQENADKTGVVFAMEKDEQGNIRGIFAVSGLGEDDQRVQIQTAGRGYWAKASESDGQQSDNHLVMAEGATYVLDKKKDSWSITQFGAYFMRVAVDSELDSMSIKNKALATAELLKSASRSDWAEIHWRLSAPIQLPILCMLAVPLARTEPRKGKFSRLLPAILVYVVYALLLMNGRHYIENGQIPSWLGFWWIHGLALALALWLYRPAKRKRKRLREKVDA